MNEATEDEIAPLIFRPNRNASRADTRSEFKKKLAVCLILISAGFERLAFYSLAGNLTFFLDSKIIRWTFPHTIIAPLIFLGKKSNKEKKHLHIFYKQIGTSYISALVFSWVSDGRLGRAKTIIIGKIDCEYILK